MEFLRKIPQGEPIAEYDRPIRQSVKKVVEFLIQRVDLRRIRFRIGPVLRPMRAVQRRQLLPEPPGDGGGIGRRCPYVLVNLRHRSQMVVIVMLLMVMPCLFLHPLRMLLLQRFHAVDHGQRLSCRLCRIQNRLHPAVGLAAQIQKQVAVLHPQNVRRGRFIGVALRSRRQQQLHIRQITGSSPRKIIGREHSCHNMQFSVCRFRRGRRLAARQQSQGQKDHPDFFHSGLLAI